MWAGKALPVMNREVILKACKERDGYTVRDAAIPPLFIICFFQSLSCFFVLLRDSTSPWMPLERNTCDARQLCGIGSMTWA